MLRFLGFLLLLLCFFSLIYCLYFFSPFFLYFILLLLLVFFCNCCKKIYNNNNKKPGNRLKPTTEKVRVKSTPKTFNMFRFVLPCSQTLYFLFKVRRARVIKNKNRWGFSDRQRKGLGVGKEKMIFLFLALRRSFSLADIFKKNEKKNKTKSVYRLVLFSRFVLFK